MTIQYDRIADALYMYVSGGKVHKTLELEDRLLVDVDTLGNIVGMEILDASNQEELIKNLESNVDTGIPITITSGLPAIV
ncbi:MAG: hypothetical protein JWM39_792 [Parcubacteria group bacterium]|jgi:uncharacterized protein YuzE|nr:hypothetical protein [Parcubacteria group bacterium]